MEHLNFEGYTNFIDEIDDEQFDNFFSKKARRKRKERQAERRGIAQLVLMYKGRGLSTKKALANAMRDINMIKRKGIKVTPKEVGNLVAQLRMKMGGKKDTRVTKADAEARREAVEEELMPESPQSARPPRRKVRKSIDKALSKVKSAIKEKQNEVDDDDVALRGGGIAPITKTSLSGENADSFFQKNKMPILVVGGLVVAGFVYIKFIKK